jgi:hypothetical protein
MSPDLPDESSPAGLTPDELRTHFARADKALTPMRPPLAHIEAQAHERQRAKRNRLAGFTAALTAAAAVVAIVAFAGSARHTARPVLATNSSTSAPTRLASPSPSASASASAPAPGSTPSPSPTAAAAGHLSATATPSASSSGLALLSPSPGGNPFVDEVWGTNAVPFKSPTRASYAGVQLFGRALAGGGAILVPAGWVYADQSYPSDHTSVMFYDPANPAARIEINYFGCAECLLSGATGSGHLNARGVLPPDTVSFYLYRNGLSAGFRESDADGYAVNGVASILGSADNPEGYIEDRVSLPATDNAIATQILNSFVDGFSSPSPS